MTRKKATRKTTRKTTRKKTTRKKSREVLAHQHAVQSRKASKKLTDAKAAAKVRAKADAWLRQGKKLFADDPHGLATTEQDYDDLKHIADCIRRGDLDVAYNGAGHLDTAVREEIPLDVWMYIGGRGLHE